MYKIIDTKIIKFFSLMLIMIGVLTLSGSQSIHADELNNEELQIESNQKVEVLDRGEQVRFSLGELYASELEKFEGKLTVTLGGNTSEVEVVAEPTEKLGGSIVFPVDSGGYEISLSDSEDNEVFKITGVIDENNDGYVHQLGGINRLSGQINAVPEKKAFNIEMGYVQGNMMMEVETIGTSPDMCEVIASLDTNADGIFQKEESFRKILSDSYTVVEGPKIDRLPLESSYDARVICNGMTVASNSGGYDLLGGEAIDSKKARSSSNVKIFAVGFKRTPYVTVVHISGETLSPPKENLEILPEDTLESWDLIGDSNSRGLVQEEEEVELMVGAEEESAKFSMNSLANWFTEHPWTYLPASLVLAIVVLGCFATIAIVSQKKNSRSL